MWHNTIKHMKGFSNAVLSATISGDYPYSVRCHPLPDHEARVLRLDLAADRSWRPGPASLLFHKHDERLWGLKSFVLTGTLDRDEHGWFLRPLRLIPGMGMGLSSGFRFVRDGRRTAARYLAKRNLPRPQIPWEEIKEVVASAGRS